MAKFLIKTDQSRSAKVLWILGLLLCWLIFGIVLIVRQEPQAEVILWSERNEHEWFRESELLRRQLNEIILEQVNFEHTAFSECLRHIEQTLESEYPSLEPITFHLEDSVDPATPVSLRLTKVPLSIVLEYIGKFEQSAFIIERARVIVFDSIDNHERFREEGWFSPGPGFFQTSEKPRKIVDFRTHLMAAGIQLAPDDSALFYPETGLLFASASRDSLELIQAYVDARFYCPVPTWGDHLFGVWYQLTSRFRAPPPPPPPPTTPHPDPFN